MQVNHVAFGTTTTLAIATGVTAIAAAAASTSIVATVVFSLLAIVLGATTIASITAWGKFTKWGEQNKGENVSAYFAKLQEHVFYAIPGFLTFVSETLVASVVNGIANGIERAITRKIAGPDFTIRTT